MGKIICISNQKGGVGKTTTAVNLATALALAEKNLLFLDLDFQGHATNILGVADNHFKTGIYDVLRGEVPIEQGITDTGINLLKLIRADTRLINAECELRQNRVKESILKNRLKSVKEKFDFIIIDCPASLNILGINGINAADMVIIPLQCEYLALESLGQYFKIFNSLKKKYKSDTEIGGILLNMYDANEAVSRKIADDVKRSFNGMVYKTIVPRSRSIRESACRGKSIILSDIGSEGARSFLSLAGEIIGTVHSSEE